MDILPDLPGGRPLKGRGAVSNATGRYERERRVRVDDGWGTSDAAPDDPPPAKTRTKILVDATRSAITRNTSPDIPFDRSINPYRGCEHGCIYCYARPSHAWLGLSPGLDFETRILAKPNAAELLSRELARKGYKPRPIALGTNTDPYQPIERRLKITRSILEVLARCNHPLTIVTKSDGPVRDIDILAPMAARNLARVFISVTTLDGTLARNLEPRAATPAKRIEAIGTLNAAGIPTGVMVAPVIPALTDHEIDAILEAAAQAGAREAGHILLRLPLEVKELFEEWLRTHYPDRADRVLNLVRETRAGALNDPRFGSRMRGEGVYARLIDQRFKIAVRRLGLAREDLTTLDAAQFRAPGSETRQLDLF
ncbi:MAG: PA0069 family radical SAM protein [Alphaproteobacteria bacterium]|nr:PA0069 family radical SAM protein [Alphaproteobacteria bacterium]